MAEKRMFSRELVESDQFLELPLSAQGLYMHICMEADDDGFVNNANRIRKVVEASKEDYQILFDRGYLLQMANGLVVVAHWKICNSIRKDRYKPTVYQSEWSKLRLLDNVYVLDEKGSKQTQSQSITAVSMQHDPPTAKRFEDFWKAYPRKEHKAMAEQEYAMLVLQGISEDMLVASAKAYAKEKSNQDPRYLNCPDTWLKKSIYTDYEVEPEKEKTEEQKEKEVRIFVFIFCWYQMDHHAFLCFCKMGNYRRKDVSFLLLKQRIASHFRKKCI